MFNPMHDRLRRRFDRFDRFNWTFWRAAAILALIIACVIGYFVWYTAHGCYQTNHILYWSSTTSCTRTKYSTRCNTYDYPVYETKCRR